jgi:uncharacterized Tic20 family protein
MLAHEVKVGYGFYPHQHSIMLSKTTNRHWLRLPNVKGQGSFYNVTLHYIQRVNLFFFLAKFSNLAKRNFQMAQNMHFLGFLVTTFNSIFLSISRFLYWVLACIQIYEGILNFFYFHILFVVKFG